MYFTVLGFVDYNGWEKLIFSAALFPPPPPPHIWIDFTVLGFVDYNGWEKLIFTAALFPSPPPTSHMDQFYGVTRGFTRLIMKTKYVCHVLISPYAKFCINPTI